MKNGAMSSHSMHNSQTKKSSQNVGFNQSVKSAASSSHRGAVMPVAGQMNQQQTPAYKSFRNIFCQKVITFE